MVKVQKPAPKTLNKTANTKKMPKEKQSVVIKKTQPALIAKAVKDVQKGAKLEKTTKNNRKSKNEEKKGASHRPLILAPLESPKPTNLMPKTDNKQKKDKTVKAAKAPPISTKKQNQKGKAEPKSKGGDVGGKKEKKSAPLNKVQKKSMGKKALKKQQLKQKRTGAKKLQKSMPKIFEPFPFDEDKFHAIVNVENIENIAKGLKQQVEQEVASKKTSIFSDYHYFLNVSCFKIPSCPKRMVKLNLKHSLVDAENDDVVIIVPDLQRGSKVDYEPTIQHYEDLFRESGVKGLKVVPFNKLRNECNTFETVRKFANTYDYFMCDGRIVGHVVGFCGKIFQKPRTTFHAVHLDNAKNLKREIEKSLHRTAYKQLHKGDLISIPVGNDRYTSKEVAENIVYIIEQLKKSYPGSLGNIRSMNIKLDIVGTSSLPIYVSMAQPSQDNPYVVGKREERMLKMKKEANVILSKFNLTKDANIVKLTKAQIKRKRGIKEAREELLAESNVGVKQKEDDGDEPVPAKKSRTEKIEMEKNKEEKVDPIEEGDDEDDDDDVDDNGDEDNEDGDGDEGDDNEGDDDDDEDDDDGDDDGDDDDDNDDECDSDDDDENDDDVDDEDEDEDEEGPAGDDGGSD